MHALMCWCIHRFKSSKSSEQAVQFRFIKWTLSYEKILHVLRIHQAFLSQMMKVHLIPHAVTPLGSPVNSPRASCCSACARVWHLISPSKLSDTAGWHREQLRRSSFVCASLCHRAPLIPLAPQSQSFTPVLPADL